MNLKRFVICCLPLLLTACERGPKESAPAGPAEVKPTLLKVDLSTPDRALKTWWNFKDVREAEAHTRCVDNNSKFSSGTIEDAPKVAQEAVLRHIHAIHARGCPPLEQFSREIQEVKVETETRAIAYATVKHLTAIPPNAVPDELDKKWRAEGSRAKYLLEKDAAGWKVSQVYIFNRYKSERSPNDWEEVYTATADSPPRYPALVSGSDL